MFLKLFLVALGLHWGALEFFSSSCSGWGLLILVCGLLIVTSLVAV